MSILRRSSVFSCLRAIAMAASSDLFVVYRSDCDLMSIYVVMIVFGLATPAPSVGFPFTCEPSVYTKSFGLHFLLWSLVCRIDVVACRCTNMGVSLQDVSQSISVASGLVLSTRVVLKP